MAKVYFISESFLKEQSIINLNVETALINNAIMDAQVLHLQTVLGSKLYKKIESLLAAGTISDPINAVYKTLLDDYIVQTLVQWTMFEALPYIRYKVINKGVSNQSSENSAPTESADFKYFQQQLKDKAEFYSQRLADHLVCNSSLYPEYTTSNVEDIHPDSNAYFSGLQLDKNYSACRKMMGYNDGNITMNW